MQKILKFAAVQLFFGRLFLGVLGIVWRWGWTALRMPDGGPTTVKQGPPILSVAKLSELVTLKVNMNVPLEASNNWFKGTWLTVGDGR